MPLHSIHSLRLDRKTEIDSEIVHFDRLRAVVPVADGRFCREGDLEESEQRDLVIEKPYG